MKRQSEPKQIETKTPGRILSQILIILGWVLIIISGIVLFGTLQQPLYRDPSIDALLTHPDSSAIIGTIGVIIGFNFPSIFACLFGVLALVRKNPNGKILILASLIVFLVNLAILFLPSSESASASISHSIDTTTAQQRPVDRIPCYNNPHPQLCYSRQHRFNIYRLAPPKTQNTVRR